jgi:serine/threonine protein kinase
MSPEQAVGRPVDRRSDIFSFGAALYEMLTGKRAFAGETTPDVLEAVVKNDPDWSKLPAGTPTAIRQLLRRCVAKDRKQRLQAIGEARIVLASPMVEAATPVAAPLRSRIKMSGWIVAAVLASALVIALWTSWRMEPDKPGSRSRRGRRPSTPQRKCVEHRNLAGRHAAGIRDGLRRSPGEPVSWRRRRARPLIEQWSPFHPASE